MGEQVDLSFDEVAKDIVKAAIQLGVEMDDDAMFELHAMIVSAMAAAWDGASLLSAITGPLHGLN